MESGHPKKILIMCLADPGGNPRPRRAIELCRSLGFHVSVMGYPTQKDLKVKEFFPLSLPSLALRSKFYRKISALLLDFFPFKKNEGLARRLWAFRYDLIGAEEMLQGREFDLLIVEDLQFLPLAFAVKGNAKILFDAREYYPRQNEGEWRFHLFEKRGRMQLCRDYLTRCDTVLTVSEGLQREYRKEFGITAELYRSTPSYADRIVQSTNPEKIRMVYHGKANRNRRLENLIDIVSMLDERFSLDLILVGNPPYQKELRRKAVLSKRIFFPEPVPFTEIIPAIGQYDIGFFYCEPT
nr:hypothetical protein [Synergistaceae bacterium]